MKASEPPESGWDEATDEAMPVPFEAPRAVAPVVAAPATPVTPRMGSSADLAPIARRARSSPELPSLVQATPPQGTPSEPLANDIQEQIFGVVRAALEVALLPLLEKQQQLEARLAWLHEADQQQAEQRAAAATNGTSARAPVLHVPNVGAHAQYESSSSMPPKTSLVPTSYGFVMTPEGRPRRPSIELALETVGPIDVPDFGRSRRAAGTVLVGLLLAGVVAAIAATVLSYT